MDRPAGDRETVLVAMSGGVDSSVAAARLLQQGHRVIGAFMRNGVRGPRERPHRQGCCSVEDAHDARRVADSLGIPFYAVNLKEGFQDLVGEFVEAYVNGLTPNPCITCNRRFKMGALLKLARRLGAASVATGHYARISRRDGRLAVCRAADASKDQSYVLFCLDQEALAATRFPLGVLTKEQVRQTARSLGLPVAEKPESMEVCFVPTGDYRDLIREHAPGALVPGEIVDQGGRVLASHGGTALYTVGQRRGLPGGQARPLYVTRVDPATRRVHVGTREALFSSSCVCGDVVLSGAAGGPPGTVYEGMARIRHRHPGVPARVTLLGEGFMRCEFQEPQAAVTPGQALVLDRGGRILLGGWIRREGHEV